jgi:CheY-like chemotaxis protein
MTATGCLDGLTVLLVEDDAFVSMLAEDVLREAGGKVLLAMRLEQALDLAASTPIDFAVLDVNLGGGKNSYPVADLLRQRGIPFIFLTGYDGHGFEESYSEYSKLQKPYTPEQLLRATASLYQNRA